MQIEFLWCFRLMANNEEKNFVSMAENNSYCFSSGNRFEIWCYECDQTIEKPLPKLQQCIDFIRTHVVNKPTATGSASIKDNQIDVSIENLPEKILMTIDTMRPLLGNSINIVNSLNTNHVDQLPRVRGLSNLGNTCFFNAVMQCLAQTPFLVPVLKQQLTDNDVE